MTESSMYMHNVIEITADETHELEGFSSTGHYRHIKVRCKDQYGHIHTHTISVYGETADALDITIVS